MHWLCDVDLSGLTLAENYESLSGDQNDKLYTTINYYDDKVSVNVRTGILLDCVLFLRRCEFSEWFADFWLVSE